MAMVVNLEEKFSRGRYRPISTAFNRVNYGILNRKRASNSM